MTPFEDPCIRNFNLVRNRGTISRDRDMILTLQNEIYKSPTSFHNKGWYFSDFEDTFGDEDCRIR